MVMTSVTMSPGTVVDDATIGTVAWSGPDYAKTLGITEAANLLQNNGDVSHYLKATNFGFAIPTGSTINGILVEIYRRRENNGICAIVDSAVEIIKSDGTIGTTNLASGTAWTITGAYLSYGSSSNLWGETWDSTKINDIDFGVVLSIRQTGTGGWSYVDHIRITVYYTPIIQSTPIIQPIIPVVKTKTYIYKQFSGGQFVGILDKVRSPPQLTSEINTAGSQLVVDLGISFQDSDSAIIYDVLNTETPDNIQDEIGNDIAVSSSITLDNIPQLNDRIEVWEITDTNPTGRIVFNGLVSKWSANYSNNTTQITVLSYGVQLDNYLVQVVPNSEITGNPVSGYDANVDLSGSSGGMDGGYLNAVCQSFTIDTPIDVSSISVYVADIYNPYGLDTSSCSLYLYEGTPLSQGSLLGSVSIYQISTIGTLTFSFSSPASLLAGDYFFDCIGGGFINRGGTQLSLGYQTTGSYSDGKMYEHLITYPAYINPKDQPSPVDSYTETTHDLIFSVFTSTGAIGNRFLSYDPSNIVKELLDNFISLGGGLTYTDDSIELSGTSVSYTFKFNTYYEALQKCVELAPANWYFYIDSGSGVVYFKAKPLAVSHTLINGKHLSNFEIGQSLEDVANLVYFTGGAIAGVNLQAYNLNTTSILNYGQWLETQSDNRVTDSDSADIIVQSILDQKSEPRFIIPNITVLANAYDISTFQVGQCVGFANFNSLVNSLVLQIMSITYTPDSAVLKLEVLPPTQSKRLEDIKRNLNAQQTENNPAT